MVLVVMDRSPTSPSVSGQDTPAALFGQRHHAWLAADHHGVADLFHEADVGDVVSVGKALVELDAATVDVARDDVPLAVADDLLEQHASVDTVDHLELR